MTTEESTSGGSAKPKLHAFYDYVASATLADLAICEWKAGDFGGQDTAVEDDGAWVPIVLYVPTKTVLKFRSENPED